MNYSQLGSQVQKQYDWEDEKTRYMEMRLETITQREQLMEDIDSIIEGFWYATWPEGEFLEDRDELTRALCDAVCKNFPAK